MIFTKITRSPNFNAIHTFTFNLVNFYLTLTTRKICEICHCFYFKMYAVLQIYQLNKPVQGVPKMNNLFNIAMHSPWFNFFNNITFLTSFNISKGLIPLKNVEHKCWGSFHNLKFEILKHPVYRRAYFGAPCI